MPSFRRPKGMPRALWRQHQATMQAKSRVTARPPRSMSLPAAVSSRSVVKRPSPGASSEAKSFDIEGCNRTSLPAIQVAASSGYTSLTDGSYAIGIVHLPINAKRFLTWKTAGFDATNKASIIGDGSIWTNTGELVPSIASFCNSSRIVLDSISVKYTGPALTAQGSFKVYIGPSFNEAIDQDTWISSVFSSPLTETYTCADLVHGRTFYPKELNPTANNGYGADNSNSNPGFMDDSSSKVATINPFMAGWQHVYIIGSDLEAAASVSVTIRSHQEGLLQSLFGGMGTPVNNAPAHQLHSNRMPKSVPGDGQELRTIAFKTFHDATRALGQVSANHPRMRNGLGNWLFNEGRTRVSFNARNAIGNLERYTVPALEDAAETAILV